MKKALRLSFDSASGTYTGTVEGASGSVAVYVFPSGIPEIDERLKALAEKEVRQIADTVDRYSAAIISHLKKFRYLTTQSAKLFSVRDLSCFSFTVSYDGQEPFLSIGLEHSDLFDDSDEYLDVMVGVDTGSVSIEVASLD